jgi:isoleucyl-tRNA synthetase
MSKSKGNAVDPFEALAKYGADTIRWYFYTNSAPWLPSRFIDSAVLEGQRKFLGTLWNTYAFFVLYASIDNFDPTEYNIDDLSLTVMDKWLLSRLNTAVADVRENMDKYRIPEAAAVLENFVDELSNWYVRRSRERFWGTEMTEDKKAAYMTLWTALVTVSKAAAPMIPFMTESIYRNLVCSIDASAPESIHLTDYPTVDEKMIDRELEEKMEDVLDAVVMGRACRNAAAVKNRQPISRMFIRADFTLDAFFTDIIRDELNVKDVIFTDDVRDFTTYTFKPQLRTVGPKYGKQLGGIQKHLASLDGNAAMDQLKAEGALKFDVDGTEVSLTEEDLLIEMSQKEGFASQEDATMTVVLDMNLTEELIEEGFAAEIVSKVQTMRKDAGFKVTDHIRLSLLGNEKLSKVAENNRQMICDKVLADELNAEKTYSVSKEWNVNGESVTITVEQV